MQYDEIIFNLNYDGNLMLLFLVDLFLNDYLIQENMSHPSVCIFFTNHINMLVVSYKFLIFFFLIWPYFSILIEVVQLLSYKYQFQLLNLH
jgi:hypothetical protein